MTRCVKPLCGGTGTNRETPYCLAASMLFAVLSEGRHSAT